MLVYSLFAAFLYLVLKSFQLLNSFVLGHLFGAENTKLAITVMTSFIVLIFATGMILIKLKPSLAKTMWIGIIGIIIIATIANPRFGVMLLTALFLYALVSVEAQALNSLTSKKNLPHSLLSVLALIPFGFSFFMHGINRFSFNLSVNSSQVFYIMLTVLAFISSYSERFAKEKKRIHYESAPPIWPGFVFLTGSALVYYLSHTSYGTTENIPFMNLILIALFYIGGALTLYLSLDAHIQNDRLAKT